MPNTTTDTEVNELIINTLTKAQYDELVANNQIVENELYLTKDEEYVTPFEVIYNTTTYAAITSALTAKQEPVCNYNNYHYVYAGKDSTYYYLTCAVGSEIKYIRINSSNTWSNGTSSWSGKQDALATQTAYSAKGSATKVPQITTNTLGQVTTITEVTITHPTELPSQSGQSGKFLTTNGSTVSWANASTTIDNSTITKNGSDQIQTVGVKDVRTTNTLKTWTGTRAQYDAITTKDANTLYNITDDIDVKSTILDLLYPIGSIYIGTMANCPLATLGIGTWQKVSEGRVLQGSDSNHSAGTTVEAGLPNITGTATFAGISSSSPGTGAFTSQTNGTAIAGSSVGTYNKPYFDASQSNSIYGNNTTVQPPAFVVNIWRRTA